MTRASPTTVLMYLAGTVPGTLVCFALCLQSPIQHVYRIAAKISFFTYVIVFLGSFLLELHFGSESYDQRPMHPSADICVVLNDWLQKKHR